jgi:hypothetical protein
VTSVGSSPDVQVRLSADVSGTGTAQAEQVLKDLTVVVKASTTDGSPLSSASDSSVNGEVIVDVGSSPLADVRAIGDAGLYVLVNPSALGDVPGVAGIPTQDLQAAQTLLGGRWFELTPDLLNQLGSLATSVLASAGNHLGSIGGAQQPSGGTSSGSLGAARLAQVRQLLDAVITEIENAPSTSTPGGYQVSGSLHSLEQAVLPALEQLVGEPLQPPAVNGSYTLGVTVADATITGALLTITVPDSSGPKTVDLSASIAHADDPVTAPPGATNVTPSLIQSIVNSLVQSLATVGTVGP